jgi:hypothetical protein
VKYQNKEDLTNKIINIAFSITSETLLGYFKRTLNEIEAFSKSQDWEDLIKKYGEKLK